MTFRPFPFITSFIALSVVLPLTLSKAMAASISDDDTDYQNYDSIVEDLQKQSDKKPAASRLSTSRNWFSNSSSKDPFENVWIHAGVGFVQATQNLSLPSGLNAHMAGRGVQVAVGIDILGPNLQAEGAVRTFGETSDSATGISLKEFDLKVLFKARRNTLGFRAGGGLSARYLTVRTGTETYDVTTPASVVTIGGDFFITPSVSLGIDLATRNAMISETFDKTSYDGTLRLDTHF